MATVAALAATFAAYSTLAAEIGNAENKNTKLDVPLATLTEGDDSVGKKPFRKMLRSDFLNRDLQKAYLNALYRKGAPLEPGPVEMLCVPQFYYQEVIDAAQALNTVNNGVKLISTMSTNKDLSLFLSKHVEQNLDLARNEISNLSGAGDDAEDWHKELTLSFGTLAITEKKDTTGVGQDTPYPETVFSHPVNRNFCPESLRTEAEEATKARRALLVAPKKKGNRNDADNEPKIKTPNDAQLSMCNCYEAAINAAQYYDYDSKTGDENLLATVVIGAKLFKGIVSGLNKIFANLAKQREKRKIKKALVEYLKDPETRSLFTQSVVQLSDSMDTIKILEVRFKARDYWSAYCAYEGARNTLSNISVGSGKNQNVASKEMVLAVPDSTDAICAHARFQSQVMSLEPPSATTGSDASTDDNTNGTWTYLDIKKAHTVAEAKLTALIAKADVFDTAYDAPGGGTAEELIDAFLAFEKEIAESGSKGLPLFIAQLETAADFITDDLQPGFTDIKMSIETAEVEACKADRETEAEKAKCEIPGGK